MRVIKTFFDLKLIKSQHMLDNAYIDMLEKHFKALAYIATGDKNAWKYFDMAETAPLMVLTRDDLNNGLTGVKLIKDFYNMFHVYKPDQCERLTLRSGKQIWMMVDVKERPVDEPMMFLYIQVGSFGTTFDRWAKCFDLNVSCWDEYLNYGYSKITS